MAKNVHCRILELEGLEKSINADKDALQTLVVKVTKAYLITSVLKLQRMLIRKCVAKNAHCCLLEVECLEESINADKDAMQTLVVEETKANLNTSLFENLTNADKEVYGKECTSSYTGSRRFKRIS